jgi:hypothetical protein
VNLRRLDLVDEEFGEVALMFEHQHEFLQRREHGDLLLKKLARV